MSVTDVKSIVLQDVVRELIARHGGVRPAARVLKVSAAYVSRLARGEKIWPSDRLLQKLGVARIVAYVRAAQR